MLMHDLPLTIDLATANRGAHPDIGFFVIGPCSSNSIKAMAEGYGITRSDVQVTNLVADRTSERREPHFPIFSILICSPIVERGREVEDHDVRCVLGHDSVDVLGADGLHPII